MKTLWTPWRMEHVLGKLEQASHCLFEPPGTASCDREHLLLLRSPTLVVLLNRFPYANGHLLVAPARHVADLTGLHAEEQCALMGMLSTSCAILRHHLRPDGFNIGLNLGQVAGAGIADHLHFHVVPRWRDDHNFITVCAEIRTIPQHIDTTYTLLVDAFQALLPQGGAP